MRSGRPCHSPRDQAKRNSKHSSCHPPGNNPQALSRPARLEASHSLACPGQSECYGPRAPKTKLTIPPTTPQQNLSKVQLIFSGVVMPGRITHHSLHDCLLEALPPPQKNTTIHSGFHRMRSNSNISNISSNPGNHWPHHPAVIALGVTWPGKLRAALELSPRHELNETRPCFKYGTLAPARVFTHPF